MARTEGAGADGLDLVIHLGAGSVPGVGVGAGDRVVRDLPVHSVHSVTVG